ncbi:leucyl/phenylalanyl-tRNA--protein transferase [Rapidithrix thailandica]|uniref:Leucyl/phenylalanyl-tRNA--protein transferase n=1 Tax=Rapidithrix thailandica TaxID=413964 RepID=A0AAW9SBB4_9BACT
MPVFRLDTKEVYFPPAYLADDSGLLAIGGDLSKERLLTAYSMGIFPWYNPDEPILWWSPNPRFILYPSQIKVSKSMRQVLRQNKFEITFDQDFEGVIRGCQNIPRPGQQGTWITQEFIDSYQQLFDMGFVHSVEVWQNGELVGGLYGGYMGKCFFGESMFAKVSNASKAGFIMLAKNLDEQGFELIDCQVHTGHLESLGGEMIPRLDFLKILEKNYQENYRKEDWSNHFRTDFEF